MKIEIDLTKYFDVDYPKSGDDRRDAFESALHEMGLWDEISSMNGSSLKSLAKKAGWLEAMPEPLAPFIKTERFQFAKLSRRKDNDD